MSQAAAERRAERFHPRVETEIAVKVEWQGQTHSATARELSMAGLFIKRVGLLPGQRFTVSVRLPDREFLAEAVVKRRTSEGVAVEFHQLDWDDMLALARFLHPRLP